MIELNLKAESEEQKIIKEYLQNNVSSSLADKINNGVKISKDDKTLLNKKDLDGFMRFACDEAKKMAEQGSRSACVQDNVVFGWAIHYFEEDSIEGNLYNEDGNEYKVEKKPTTPAPKPEIKKKENNQTSFFDLLDSNSKEEKEEDFILSDEEIEQGFEEAEEREQEEQQNLIASHGRIYDESTGEILQNVETTFDLELMKMLAGRLNIPVKHE